MRSPANGSTEPIQYVSDMLVALRARRRTQTFLIRAHIGNYSSSSAGSSANRWKIARVAVRPIFSLLRRHGPLETIAPLLASSRPHGCARQRVWPARREFPPRPLRAEPPVDTLLHLDEARGPRSSPREHDVVSATSSGLFERTYAAAGVNLEDCLIDRHRCGQLSRLAGAQARELSDLARTFLRRIGDDLPSASTYSQWLIEELERQIRGAASAMQHPQLIAFVEENQSRAPRCARLSPRVREIESEDFARNLELQAQVDTYLVPPALRRLLPAQPAHLAHRPPLAAFSPFRQSMPEGLFPTEPSRPLRRETQLAKHYHACLDALNSARRIDEIRVFHSLDYAQKSSTSSR